MSALGRSGHRADIANRSLVTRSGASRPPNYRIAGDLFDHLVRADDERLRKGKAERFRSLEVEDQLEFRRLLDGKIGGLCPFQYFVDV